MSCGRGSCPVDRFQVVPGMGAGHQDTGCVFLSTPQTSVGLLRMPGGERVTGE